MFKTTPAVFFFPYRGSFHSHSQWFTWHTVLLKPLFLQKAKIDRNVFIMKWEKKKKLSMTSFP